MEIRSISTFGVFQRSIQSRLRKIITLHSLWFPHSSFKLCAWAVNLLSDTLYKSVIKTLPNKLFQIVRFTITTFVLWNLCLEAFLNELCFKSLQSKVCIHDVFGFQMFKVFSKFKHEPVPVHTTPTF